MANGPAGMTRARKAPTRAEIERTYDQALDRFIRQNQDKKQEQSSVKSVMKLLRLYLDNMTMAAHNILVI